MSLESSEDTWEREKRLYCTGMLENFWKNVSSDTTREAQEVWVAVANSLEVWAYPDYDKQRRAEE